MFLREGFAGISVDDIASSLSMSKKTFYKLFESKDDLLGRVVERLIREIDTGFRAILLNETSFVHKLDAVMLFVAGQIGRIMRPFMHDIQRHAPHYWQRVQEFRRQRIAANLMGLLEEGIRGGYIRKDINPRILFLAFVGTVESIMNPSVLANESFSGDEAIRSILRLLFHGALTEDASRQLSTLHDTQPHITL